MDSLEHLYMQWRNQGRGHCPKDSKGKANCSDKLPEDIESTAGEITLDKSRGLTSSERKKGRKEVQNQGTFFWQGGRKLLESPPGRLNLLHELGGDIIGCKWKVKRTRQGVGRKVKIWTSRHGKQRGSRAHLVCSEGPGSFTQDSSAVGDHELDTEVTWSIAGLGACSPATKTLLCLENQGIG